MAKKNAKKGRLRVQRTVDVPLQEVSGICLRRDLAHEMSLIAVGDRAATLAWTHLPQGRDGPLDWHTVDISQFAGSTIPADDPQIEAVCADGTGRVLLLQEAPPRAELVDLTASRVIASISLEIEGSDELARSWANPEASRGEGAVLLPGGHLLVAKEKHPAVFIEFGPRGSKSHGLAHHGALAEGALWPIDDGDHRFVALNVWWPDKALGKVCEDFSDLEIGPDGRLYVLSDKSGAIARLDDLPPGGDKVTLSASWRLEDLDDKPEGLSFSANGQPVVALDKRKARNNLVLLEPAIAE